MRRPCSEIQRLEVFQLELDSREIVRYLRKHIIVGLTYLDHEGNFVEQVQFHGYIVRINQSEGIVIQIGTTEKEYALPPDLASIKNAPPGEYRFRTTGEVVNNPDFMTSWTITKPDTSRE